MIKIDGSFQEGGGQIIRTALALSAITGKPFTAEKIRNNRPVPGLKAQHVTCVNAVQQLCNAQAEGLKIGSESLTFRPEKLVPKDIDIDIGTAGSITLVLQSLLLPAIYSGQPVKIFLKGGTDVAWSQPIDYFANVFCPLIQNFVEVRVSTKLRGFYPKGGGIATVMVGPKKDFQPLELTSHDEILGIKGKSFASESLQGIDVAERQVNSAKKFLEHITSVEIIPEYSKTLSPGSGLVLWAEYPRTIIGADSLGKKGKPAEFVGEEAAKKLLEEINNGAVVDSLCADALIPFLAVAGGKIKTSKITKHTLANIYVAEKFLDTRFEIDNDECVISALKPSPS